ncbi:MAG: helicase-associated domain-containing protein [Microthrixaceae bacterium]|nr:helicase-associated domain-containing protein [Microthrixaceae bacterium]
MALDEAITECLADLRLLGVVTPSGPSALTRIGRLALEDPGALEALDLGTARDAIVQADMSIICPPGMDVDLLTRIESLASLDSDHGTRTYTLEESRIIDAVRAGDSAESIVSFLEDLSQVAIPDTVYRLVCDAAQRVGQVRVAPATSVLVTEDPVALAKATKLKSAKLTALSATVAVSSLPVDKLMAILDRSGLAPTVTGPGADAVVPRSASARAAELERRAEQHRDLAARTGIGDLAAQAESFEREAAAARNPGSRLVVNGPLAVTPAVLERVGQ